MKKALFVVLALAVLGGTVSAQTMTWKEAPELAELVKAGKLPPVAQRLPTDPLVVTPTDRVGQYGGTWRMAFQSTTSAVGSEWTYVIKDTEIRFAADLKTLVPNILKSFTASPDNRVFTFYLRHGLRWSNGDPYDADDYAFWWNDMVLNDAIYPSKPSEFMAGGRLPKFEKLDKYTIRFTFDMPYSTFLQRLAQPRYTGNSPSIPGGNYGGSIAKPSAYLKKFHPKYAYQDAIDREVKAGGFNTWADMFVAKLNLLTNPEVPVLNAWVNIDKMAGALMRFERNPYYWKVDTAGNQLPYIGKQEMYLYADVAACVLKALAGEVDFQYRGLSGAANYAPLMKNADKGGYYIVPTETLNSNNCTVFMNRTTTDPIHNKLFNDLRFRQALSYAIDRNEINTLTRNGMTDVTQAAPPKSAASYEKDVAEMYTKFDIAKANALLDAVGLKWDAKHEWRLGSDGKPLIFTNIFYNDPEAMELIKKTWVQIGINVNNKVIDRTLWESTMYGNDWDLSNYAIDIGGGAYLPLGSVGIFPQDRSWRPNSQWGIWFNTGGKEGFEPPAEVKKQRALFDEYVTTATPQRMVVIEKEAFRNYVTNLFAIGVVNRSRMDVYFVANRKMKNIPKQIIDDVSFFHPASFFFEQ